MAMSDHRNTLRGASTTVEEIKEFNADENSTEYILLDEVESTLNDIESDIEGIIDELSEIKGLSEIDNIVNNLKQLNEKLY